MKIRYINSLGKELTLDAWPKRKDYILQNWEGFGDVAVSLQTRQSPYQDGVTVMDQLLEPRHLSLEIVILGDAKQEIYDRRRFIQSLFNPKLGLGRLEWHHPNGKIYALKVMADGTPQFPGGEARTSFSQIATVDLVAPDPAWEDAEVTELLLSTTLGRFAFPLELPTEMGLWDKDSRVINNGDLATPVQITFNGPADNPFIENKTAGKIIKVNRELDHGEKLVINTVFGRKQVHFIDEEGNIENAFGDIDLDSEFWQLQPGENRISYETAGLEATSVLVLFKQRYVGV